MKHLSPAEEYVFRRIAGQKKCSQCDKWVKEQELFFGLCRHCRASMFIPQKVFKEIEEAAKILRRNEYFESSKTR